LFILGVIPAKAGSKGIKHKNIFPLAGRPLIHYTIFAANGSKLNDFVITTDIFKLIPFGALLEKDKIIERPKKLAQDDTPMLPVIQHAVNEYEKRTGNYVDAVMTLQPTSPLRTAEDIDNCVRLFQKPLPDEHHLKLVGKPKEYWDSLVSVTWGIHPIKSYTVELEPFLPQTEPYDKHKHKCLTRNGAIFITRRDLLDSGRLIGDYPLFYVMPKSRSIDIDDHEDLMIAEAILKYREGDGGD